ncbi:MAG: hypothetical protein LBT14_05470 [Treponema sp.]|jgi:ribonucleoside-diphosphate reductase alpha chain|nr:hypothetical protein [Treponema sp.]
MLTHQIAAPNSPQWFNTGLYAVYGIDGPSQGHYYVENTSGELKNSDSAYKRPQPRVFHPPSGGRPGERGGPHGHGNP